MLVLQQVFNSKRKDFFMSFIPKWKKALNHILFGVGRKETNLNSNDYSWLGVFQTLFNLYSRQNKLESNWKYNINTTHKIKLHCVARRQCHGVTESGEIFLTFYREFLLHTLYSKRDKNGQENKFSGVRCQVLHVMCHMRCVLCQVSHDWCHLLPVINANSNIHRPSRC